MKKNYPLNLPVSAAGKSFSPSLLIDAEKLLHLNPIWIVKELRTEQNTFEAELQDHETEKEFTVKGEIVAGRDDSLTVEFSEGDYTSVTIAPATEKYEAVVTYRDSDFKDESDLERNTVMWLRSIQEYLRLYRKSSLNTVFFRFIMNRIVMKMTPSQRKISLMLLRITAVELLVILIIVIGYVFFVLKPLGSS